MMHFAWLLMAVLSSSTAASNETQAPLPVASVSVTGLPAFLHVRESSGCSGSEGSDELVAEFAGGDAVFRQRIWLNLRESVTEGPVVVTRDGETLRAEVETTVAPVKPGESVPACIRPLELVLDVPGLAEGKYGVRFARRAAKP